MVPNSTPPRFVNSQLVSLPPVGIFKKFLFNKQLLVEVEPDMMNYQNRGLCYLPKPKAIIG